MRLQGGCQWQYTWRSILLRALLVWSFSNFNVPYGGMGQSPNATVECPSCSVLFCNSSCNEPPTTECIASVCRIMQKSLTMLNCTETSLQTCLTSSCNGSRAVDLKTITSQTCTQMYENVCLQKDKDEQLSQDCNSLCTGNSSVFSSGKTCRDVRRRFCRRHRRAPQCVQICTAKRDCPTLVDDLLQGNFTDDDTDAALSLVGALSRRDSTGELDLTLESVTQLHRGFRRRQSQTVNYFNESSSTELTQIFDDVLNDQRREEWLQLQQQFGFAPSLLSDIEETVSILGMARINRQGRLQRRFHFSGSSIMANVECATTASIYTYDLLQNASVGFMSEARVEIMVPDSDGEDDCPLVVSSALIRNLDDYINENSSDDNNTVTNTHLVTLQVTGQSVTVGPVLLVFTPIQDELLTANPRCVFWDFSIGNWSTENVTTQVNSTHYICSSNHLTSFAVLVDVNNNEEIHSASEGYALNIVSYIGCSISIICLILTILFLLHFRKSLNKGVLLYIHLNLSVALLLVLIVFVAGLETATGIQWLCTVVAVLLHYLLLSVFCWMLAEGIMLYLLIVRVFGMAAERWYYLLILGWGFPVPIVAISAGVRHKYYGNNNFCWLQNDKGTIWAFAAPMILIVLVNAIFLVLTVVSIVRVRRKGAASKGLKSQELVVTAIKGTIILLPLLGITWVLGLLAVNRNTTVFAWLFTIFNSLQGCFIFVFHVLRNRKVQSALRKLPEPLFTRKATKENDKKDSTITEVSAVSTLVEFTHELVVAPSSEGKGTYHREVPTKNGQYQNGKTTFRHHV